MRNRRYPLFEIKDKLLYHAFLELAPLVGCSGDEIRAITRSLPDAIRSTYTYESAQTGERTYTYGSPFSDLPMHGVVLSGQQEIPVRVLLRAMVIATRYFSPNEFLQFRDLLGDPDKHLSTLFEFRPFLDCSPVVNLRHEAPGVGSKTIDWEIDFGIRAYLVEVKTRSGTALSNFVNIIARPGLPESPMPLPPTKPEKFFKDVACKFSEEKRSSHLRGAWIFTGSCEKKSVLQAYFDSFLKQRIDFCLIGGWKRSASIVCSHSLDPNVLERDFGISIDESFFYVEEQIL